jgi:hypothetical protein
MLRAVSLLLLAAAEEFPAEQGAPCPENEGKTFQCDAGPWSQCHCNSDWCHGDCVTAGSEAKICSDDAKPTCVREEAQIIVKVYSFLCCKARFHTETFILTTVTQILFCCCCSGCGFGVYKLTKKKKPAAQASKPDVEEAEPVSVSPVGVPVAPVGESQKSVAGNAAAVGESQKSTKEKLQDLKALLDDGLITQEEFDKKKGELLQGM